MTALRPRRASGEGGAVAVMVGLMLPVLLGFTGLTIDIGHWYFTGNREQKAADAAALAGAVFLPGDPARAISTARAFAAQNGYAVDVDTVVTPKQESNPAQLRVTIIHTIDNYFTPIFGMPRTTITRTSVAEFQGPVPMGSPVNSFGDEPLGAGETKWSTQVSNPQFWGVVAGPHVGKVQGDAIQSRVCTASEDNCVGGINTEYNANGYFYSVTVPASGAGKRLAIEIFDPIFANVGDTCGTNLANATNAQVPTVTDAAARYVTGTGKFCTGDGFPGGSGPPLTTSFVFREPTNTPWDPMSASVLRTGSCSPRQYKGYNTGLFQLLDKNSPTADPAVQAGFRRWVRACEIPNAKAGDYLIQIRTDVSYGSDAAGAANTTSGDGQNRFALRAAFVSGANGPAVGSQAGLRIAGTSVMAMYANFPGANTKFFLARVPSGSGGHALQVGIFDPSDADDNGSLRIVPPTDSNVGSNFSGCVADGPVDGNLTNCLVHTNSTDFQGKWQTVRVPIPTNYTCDDLDPLGCWVKIEFIFPGGKGVHDTTTWRATMEGDPVRIIE
jgi:Flp pilus assembly protein TadG